VGKNREKPPALNRSFLNVHLTKVSLFLFLLWQNLSGAVAENHQSKLWEIKPGMYRFTGSGKICS
jgi:hypothetical protein